MTAASVRTNFEATTWTQLTQEVAQIEKEITEISHKADVRVLKEGERVKMVAQRRAEVLEAHREKMKEKNYEFERRLTAIEGQGNRELAECVREKEEAEARIVAAELAAQKAEERAKELEKQVKELYRMYDKACADHDQRVDGVRVGYEERVQKKIQDSNRLVLDTSLYATQIQSEGMSYMQELEALSRRKKLTLEKEALDRSRYKDLFDVARSSKPVRHKDRGHDPKRMGVIQDWHNSWDEHTRRLMSPPESASPGFRDVYSSLSNHETIVAEDILDTVVQRSGSASRPDSVRSKDRALSRASEYKRERDMERALGDVEQVRPKTAPR